VELLSGSERIRTDFAVDPEGILSACGLDNLGPADVQDAILLAEDNRTVAWSDAYGTGAGLGGTDFGSGAPAVGVEDDDRGTPYDRDPHDVDREPTDAPEPEDGTDVAAPDEPSVDDVLDEGPGLDPG
jgi:hypothetical protein